ncbi:transmembrane protein 6/97 [Phycomyces nitens]|nr:transmembrane protein 6/97 [Phycomyces nitens]
MTRFSERRLDLIFFTYFAIHIPTTLFIDLQIIYPSSLVPLFLKNVIVWYVDQFGDPFLAGPTKYWFLSFVMCEAFVQLPFFIYACYGLYYNTPLIRLGLAIYASHVMTTVLPVMVDMWFNPEHNLSLSTIGVLYMFYGPYFFLPLAMLVDSYQKVASQISTAVHVKQS